MALVSVHYRSDQLKKTVEILLAVPDCSRDFQRPLSEYPVVYLLHGLSEDASSWIRKSNAERYALERGLVLVMPSADRSMYCDGVLGQNYFTYLTRELPDYLEKLFGLSRKRERNFIMGFSMGGFGAARAALTCPEQYAAWGCLSGLVDLTPMLLRLDDATRAEFPFLAAEAGRVDVSPLNPVNLINGGKHRCLRGYLGCGLEDDLLVCTRRFQARSEQAGLPNRFVYVPDRGHNWVFWDEQIPAFFDFLLENEYANAGN